MAQNRGMFLIRDDGELVEMLERAYDSENLLQGLLARYRATLNFLAAPSVV